MVATIRRGARFAKITCSQQEHQPPVPGGQHATAAAPSPTNRDLIYIKPIKKVDLLEKAAAS
jgi:hypothetical protein